MVIDMIHNQIFDFYPIIYDSYTNYTFLRNQGCSSDETLKQILNDYSQELDDEDDSFAVFSGIALAQRDYGDIDEHTKQAALELTNQRLFGAEEHEKRVINSILRQLSKDASPSKSKKEPKKRSYSVNWAVGDTFCHRFTHPDSEKAGICGWFLLFRKVGEYIDWKGHPIQLGYLTLCPQDALPQTVEDLNELGFLRVMNHGKKWDYLVQADIQSKRAENALKMERIGCFPNAISPVDEMQSSPEVAMPLFSGIDKKIGCPRYEDVICSFYQWYGIGGR